MSQSAGLLITARGLQGFGAALIAPAALSILAVTFAEGHERNRALGIFGAVGGTSASVGVIASGLLTDGPGWRWVFFINVPIGVLLIGSAFVVLARDNAQRSESKFDAAGATTITGGLLLLVYALNRGADHGWTSASTLLLFSVAGLLLIAFVGVESTIAGAARARRRAAASHPRGRQPLGVLHVRRVLLVHLPGFADDAAGVRLLADQDGRVMAGDVGDGIHRLRAHRCAARGNGRRAQIAHRRSHAAGTRHVVAGASACRRRLCA